MNDSISGHTYGAAAFAAVHALSTMLISKGVLDREEVENLWLAHAKKFQEIADGGDRPDFNTNMASLFGGLATRNDEL